MKSDSRKTATVASESRKIRKPLMEKKRRARINDSLETLKQILLESKTTLKESTGKKSGQRTAKLEKADILEMTVRYLQHLRSKINHSSSPQEHQAGMKEEIEIRPADSSCDVKYGVALVPARLHNGTIAFVVPTKSIRDQTHRNDFEDEGHDDQSVWRPW